MFTAPDMAHCDAGSGSHPLHQWRINGSPCAAFRARRGLIAHREHCETRYAAKSWTVTRRVIARIEASIQGMDIRTIVMSIRGTAPERLYELDYCDRDQAENPPLAVVLRKRLPGEGSSCTRPN